MSMIALVAALAFVSACVKTDNRVEVAGKTHHVIELKGEITINLKVQRDLEDILPGDPGENISTNTP